MGLERDRPRWWAFRRTGVILEHSRGEPHAAALNEYAWLLLTCGPADLCHPAAARTAATKANEMSAGANAGFLDTLALAHRLNGDTEKALEIQR